MTSTASAATAATAKGCCMLGSVATSPGASLAPGGGGQEVFFRKVSKVWKLLTIESLEDPVFP